MDDDVYETQKRWNWYLDKDCYAVGKHVYLHRQIMNAQPGQQVDHIDGNKRDDRRCNLRLATNAQNAMNRTKRSGTTSRFKGVYWDDCGRNWRVEIKCNGVKRRLGRFEPEREIQAA